MPSIGDQFRQEREKRGLPLADVARQINVGPHLLEALEQGDLAALPGGPFNKGIVRAYARHLDLDAEDAIRRFGREERARGLNSPDANDEPRVPRVEIRHDGDRPTLVVDWQFARMALAMVAVGLVVVVGATLWFTGEPEVASAAPDAEINRAGLQTTDDAAGAPEANRTLEPAVATAAPAESGTGRPDATVAGTAPVTQTVAPEPDRVPAPEPQEQALAPEPVAPLVATDQPDPARAAPVRTPARQPEAPTLLDTHIANAGIGLDIANHPFDSAGQSFKIGDKVWFWTRAIDADGASVQHVWMLEGQPIARYELTVKGPDYRNASFKTLWDGSTGNWTVEARSADGQVLVRREFTCVEDRGTANRAAPPSGPAAGGI